MKIKLLDIAHGRSGDKGDAANVGIIAYDDKGFEIIKKQLTTERVKKHKFSSAQYLRGRRYCIPET